MHTDKLIRKLSGDVTMGRNVSVVMNGRGYGFLWGDLITLLPDRDLNRRQNQSEFIRHY